MICIADERDIAGALQIKCGEKPAKAAANNHYPRSFGFHLFDYSLLKVMVTDNGHRANQVGFEGLNIRTGSGSDRLLDSPWSTELLGSRIVKNEH